MNTIGNLSSDLTAKPPLSVNHIGQRIAWFYGDRDSRKILQQEKLWIWLAVELIIELSARVSTELFKEINLEELEENEKESIALTIEIQTGRASMHGDDQLLEEFANLLGWEKAEFCSTFVRRQLAYEMVSHYASKGTGLEAYINKVVEISSYSQLSSTRNVNSGKMKRRANTCFRVFPPFFEMVNGGNSIHNQQIGDEIKRHISSCTTCYSFLTHQMLAIDIIEDNAPGIQKKGFVLEVLTHK